MQALKNVEAIVEAAGSKKEQSVQMNLYIPNVKLWDKVDGVCKKFFVGHKSAHIMIPMNARHFGFKIEVDAIAHI